VKDQTEPGVGSAQKKVNAFDKSAQKMQDRMDKINRSKFRVVLDALDRASSVIDKVSTKVRGFAGKTFSFSMKVLDFVTTPLRGMWNLITSVQGAILGAGGTFAGIIKPMSIAGDFEQTNIAFTTMLKSAEKASGFLKNAATFAANTPFDFPELLNSSKLLLAFGFEAEKILDLMTVIGDTSSALGAGSEGIDRITRALGQMQTKGRAQTEELLQLQELGVPATQILKEELGLTAEQVGNIGKESIEASKVINALLTGMEKRYSGLMEKQSKSSKGMLANLQDLLQNTFLKNWGEGLWEGVNPWLRKITTWVDENSDTVDRWAEKWREAGANISKWVSSKVENLQKTISEMVSSQEWKDAQTFGEKAKIAWNTIIAEPFSEWWSSTGKAWLTEKAGNIGEELGSALKIGLLGLLGIDVSEALSEGKSIGSSFVQGFKDGFDTEQITEALKEWGENNKEIVFGIGLVLSYKLIEGLSWLYKGGKWLYGGAKTILGKFGSDKGSNDADVSLPNATPGQTLVSTMNVAAGVVNVYGANMNNGSPSVYPSGGKSFLPLPSGGGAPLLLPGASSAAGAGGSTVTVLKNGSALIGTGGAIKTGLATVGSALGSSATTLGGAAVAGGASIAGGIVGGASLISGIIDFYKGGKSTDEDEKAAYNKSGAAKVGGVAAGAAIGAAVGTFVPIPGVGTGVGALVGAGIGGVAGWIAGGKIKKDMRAAKFETQELQDAVNDTKVTAEEFGVILQKNVAQNLKNHFGDVVLSLEEIQTVAKNITFGDATSKMTTFADASSAAESALSQVKSSAASLAKLNWKASLGLKLSDDEQSSYKEAVNAFVDNAQEYIESKHYEVTAAVNLILDKDKSSGITKSTDAYFVSLQKDLNTLDKDLTAKVKVALKDGVLTLDEQAEIQNLQDQIAAITSKLSEAQTEAELETLKIKFTGSNVSAESFAQLQAELQTQVESATETYDEALTLGITNLKLQLSDGAISQKEYDAQLKTLTDGYQAKIEALNVRVTGFQLDVLASAYATELSGILPEIEGTTAEKLSFAINNALANGSNPATWDAATVASMLGIEDLSVESQAAIAQLLSAVALTIPDGLSGKIAETDFSGVGDTAGAQTVASVANGITSNVSDLQPAVDTLRTAADGYMTNAFSAPFNVSTKVNITADYNLTNPYSYTPHANGDIVTKPHMGLVGEDGPESIIPLTPSRRARGIDLWERTGEILGVMPHAEGGVFGDADAQGVPVSTGQSAGNLFKVDIKLEPEFIIQGDEMDEESIVAVIKASFREIADDLGDEFAEKLLRIFANIPVKG
jgi:tape measure domain-containing protein